MQVKKHVISALICVVSSLAQAQAPSAMTPWEDVMHDGRPADAYALALKQLQGGKSDFYLGVLALQSKKWSEAVGHLSSAAVKQPDLVDYIHLFRGQAFLAMGEMQKALDDFKKTETVTRLKFIGEVARFYQAETHLALKQWKKAEPLYKKVQKKLQRTKYHPAILWGTMTALMNSNQGNKICRSAKELYLKYPAYEKVADWGIVLGNNTLNGKKINCPATFAEQRMRIQRMLWAGLEEKALGEIQGLRARASGSNVYSVDELMVTYLLHEGHVDEAQRILANYTESKGNDNDYLMLLGKVHSRSPIPQKGIEAYYRSYQVAPKASAAAPALYQAAFLSYFVRDYAGAYQKFKEFTQKYPTHRGYTDSIWYLAWLQYLQKDYAGAEKGFLDIRERKKKNQRQWRDHKDDKIDYWIAMCKFRQDKKEEALEMFSAMTHDDAVGYYSVAAYQRIRQIPQRGPASLVKKGVHENWWLPEAVAVAVEKDHDEENLTPQAAADPFETTVDAMLAAESPSPDSSNELVIEKIPQYLGKDIKAVYFNNLEKSLQRAHALVRVGKNELAFREVLDSENQKLTVDQKRWLLQAHQSVNSFNRSVVLASYFFSDEVSKLGVHHGSDYWSYSYPKAYEKTVQKHATRLQVPPELVWSIMRAETIFRPDAISPVGARGLMQVMPRTGRRIAGMTGEAFEVDDLLQPPSSIKFGTYYLQRLSKKFKGSIPLIAAAYNGGPHRVQAWMHYFGDLDLDEFVEHIPYQETRNYVKKVSKYYAIYNLVYKKKTDAMDGLAKPIGFKLEGSVPTMETWEAL